jgi:LAO/AO transport system kinase
VDDLVERVLAGDVRAAARLCRFVDDRSAGYRELLSRLERLREGCPRAAVVGVTGSPGAGKSTLVNALVSAYRAQGLRVGVVAVDPTSPYTGGAILGDRVRMQRHFEDPDVFIRSLATRGALGGLSRSAREIVRVLEGWGASVVLLETVGVGQDELDVTLVADSTIVVVAPGGGDDVQAVKAGLFECADVFVVNKADRPGAESSVRDLENMLALGAISAEALADSRSHTHRSVRSGTETATASRFSVSVVRTVATNGEGVPELVQRLGEHRLWLGTPEGRCGSEQRIHLLLVAELRGSIHERLIAENAEIARAAAEVVRGSLTVDEAVERLAEPLFRPRAP